MTLEKALRFSLPAVLALLLLVHAHRERQSRALLGYLGFFVAVDFTYVAWLVPALENATHPFEGADRALYHLRQTLFLGTVFGFTWASGVIFDCRPARIAAWVLLPVTSLTLVLGYPMLDASLVHTLSSVAGLLVCWYAIVAAALVKDTVAPRLIHLVTMLLVAADSVVVLYGFVNTLAPGIASAWEAVNLINIVTFSACVILYLGAILKKAKWSGSSSSSA